MKCPNCGDTVLIMTERIGIEIDYCPDCRGVWLDRGELDKIIERSLQADASGRMLQDRQGVHRDEGRWERARSQHEHHGHHDHERSSHGKKSFWQEIFD